MCFSAGASFGTAAGLSVISLLSLQKASSTKKIIPLAASPLFFALQQACEGVVWLTLNAGNTTGMLHWIGVYGFLFFASLWWPIWIPYILYVPETNTLRKKLLFITGLIGTFAALLLFTSWVFYTTGAEIVNHHLNYPVINYPFNITNKYIAQSIMWIIGINYCTATIMPFFISSIPYVWILGMLISTELILSYLFYYMALPSVWCFFAAIDSVLLYFIIRKHLKKHQ